jgi:hypothetical protein
MNVGTHAAVLPSESSSCQDFLPCLQTAEFGFEHIPSPTSLILIARDLMEHGVRHLRQNSDLVKAVQDLQI